MSFVCLDEGNASLCRMDNFQSQLLSLHMLHRIPLSRVCWLLQHKCLNKGYVFDDRWPRARTKDELRENHSTRQMMQRVRLGSLSKQWGNGASLPWVVTLPQSTEVGTSAGKGCSNGKWFQGDCAGDKWQLHLCLHFYLTAGANIWPFCLNYSCQFHSGNILLPLIMGLSQVK